MGGRAISRMIDRASREEKWTPDGIPYVRIEHATDPSDDSLKKAAGHGISFVTQPIFLYAESKSYLSNLGQEWTRQCYPIRHILEEGVVLGFSTDAPATFWAVPSDGAAQAAGFPDMGKLIPGYRADFAVLSDDILHISPEKIDQIRVEETYISGECVYRRNGK